MGVCTHTRACACVYVCMCVHICNIVPYTWRVWKDSPSFRNSACHRRRH